MPGLVIGVGAHVFRSFCQRNLLRAVFCQPLVGYPFRIVRNYSYCSLSGGAIGGVGFSRHVVDCCIIVAIAFVLASPSTDSAARCDGLCSSFGLEREAQLAVVIDLNAMS
eukprot:198832-Alexandrium_andersonii.AAC.1